MELSVLWILASAALFNALKVNGTLPKPILSFEEKIYEEDSTTITCTFPYHGIKDVTLHIKGNVTFSDSDCIQSLNKENYTSIACTAEVTKEMHEMEFFCEAEFKTQSNPQTMHLQTEPEFTVCPTQLVWTEGQKASFHCNATGYPQPNVTCQKNKMSYKNVEQFTATREMSGNYTCTAKNFDVVTKQVTVTVEYKPKVSNITVNPPLHNEGDAVSLTCHADGLPDPMFSWSRPPSNVEFSPDNQTVIIQKLTQSHLGRYTCTVRNPHGTDTLVQTLDLEAKPKITHFEIQPSAQVLEGANVTLTCAASGFPPPLLRWNTPITDVELSPDNSTVRIWKVKKKHVGEYQCHAQNKHGTDKQTQQLTLGERPKVRNIKVQPLQSVEEGANVTVTCVADGVPPPTYSWSTPPAAPNMQFSPDKSVINIWKAEKGQDGNYQCKVQNKHGEDTMTQKISVKESKSKPSSGQNNKSVTAIIVAMLMFYVCLFCYSY